MSKTQDSDEAEVDEQFDITELEAGETVKQYQIANAGFTVNHLTNAGIGTVRDSDFLVIFETSASCTQGNRVLWAGSTKYKSFETVNAFEMNSAKKTSMWRELMSGGQPAVEVINVSEIEGGVEITFTDEWNGNGLLMVTL